MIINAILCGSPDYTCEFCKVNRCGAFLCQNEEYCENMIMRHIYIPNDECEDCGQKKTLNERKKTAGIKTPDGWGVKK